MLALAHDDITESLAAIGGRIVEGFGKPKGILAVSAHYYRRGTLVQTEQSPRQIYDMYGFPEELYQVKYPVEGSPELGNRVLATEELGAREDNTWGIDHGVWTPLVHMFPKADIPIVELSVNANLDARASYEAGRLLAPLRDEGYLVTGSGNVVHNLRETEWENPGGSKPAERFNAFIVDQVQKRNDDAVLNFQTHADAAYAVPTPDHFLPLPYVLGASQGEAPLVFNNRCNLGSMAMTGFAFGLE